MIKFEIAIPKKEGLKDWEIDSLAGFLQDINRYDIEGMLDGCRITSKGSPKYPLTIKIKRSK